MRHAGSWPSWSPRSALFASARPKAWTGLESLVWYLLALGVLSVGGEHLYLWQLYFHRVHIIGPLFILNFAASLPIAVAVLLVRSQIFAVMAGGFALVTVGAYLWSSLFGLFGYKETLVGRWQLAAASTEGATVVLATVALVMTCRQLARQSPGPQD